MPFSFLDYGLFLNLFCLVNWTEMYVCEFVEWYIKNCYMIFLDVVVLCLVSPYTLGKMLKSISLIIHRNVDLRI